MAAKNERDAAYAGQAIYTPATLALYDLVVLAVSNHVIWRCPTSRLARLYNENVTDNHLDVGVGTGWFLDHSRFPGPSPRIGLMDLNASALGAASHRIARYRPEQYQANVLRPVPDTIPPFDSLSLNALLHCLPGNIAQKSVVFDNLLPLLRPGGVIFGSTLLSIGVERSSVARALMRAYNRRGFFSNEDDSVSALRTALEQRFRAATVEVVGCAALFVVRNPIQRTS
jgi:ubiquinone/menaquinone biosynthesis C-methylase UbiE